MHSKKWRNFKFVLLSLSIFLWLAVSYALAQEPDARLIITGTDVSSLPSIELQLVGIDGQGQAMDLTQAEFSIQHDNSPVGLIEKHGVQSVGTFTLFLIDIPTGVVDQLPAVQDAIIQYASAPTMMEQVDSVAIYQVGEVTAAEMLPPDSFYNSIRNVFAPPLAAETRATALVDSMMGVLEQIGTLKPTPEQVASMVVITDGTDVVSTRYEPEEVALRAAELGIPIHTIWLDNVDLSAASRERGQNYLSDLASQSRGLSAELENQAQLTEIWNRIASFRDHARIRYSIGEGELSGGTFPVEVSLATDRQVRAETMVTIVANVPTLIIDLPAESRSLTLPSLEEPVELRLTTTVSWLDGVERQLTAAQLIINGTAPQSISVENIADFTLEVTGLVYGDNSIQIAILDEQGMRVTSPPLLLTVTEGPTSLPDELEPAGGFGQIIGRILLFVAGLIILAGVGFFVWRQGWLAAIPDLLPRGRSGRSRSAPVTPAVTYIPDSGAEGVHEKAMQRAVAFLDVLESVSRVPTQIAISGVQVRIGRSPSQAEIAFENDITVSRLHATLLLEGNNYRIFDEQSTSGTWVNEQQVPEYGIQLTDGDEIHLGAVHLRFRQPTS